MTKWRWYSVKQTGVKPAVARSGMSCVGVPNSSRAFVFGGVTDPEAGPDAAAADAGSDSDDDGAGEFFNDIYTITVDSNEKATWQKGIATSTIKYLEAELDSGLHLNIHKWRCSIAISIRGGNVMKWLIITFLTFAISS